MSKGSRAGTRKSIGDWEWNSTILWSKIVKTDDDSCWAWLGSVGPHTNLYGGRKLGVAQMTQARRILYRDVFGEDCEDKQIKHTCGNAFCMNWQHFDVKPNLRRFRMDGTDRHIEIPRQPQPERCAKIIPVQANARWWNI